MFEIIRAENRHFADHGWLKTYWLFSFSEYRDPANIRWGTLRVFNDDVVQPHAGFPMHPHDEMEIITLVLEGELTHNDSMGNAGVIRPWEVQRMTAGTGVTHSEANAGDAPVHLYQIWVFPQETGLKPSYEQAAYGPEDCHNRLCAIASGDGGGVIRLNTDASIYRARLDGGAGVSHPVTADRRVFVYVTSGSLSVEGHRLEAHDQVRLVPEDPSVSVEAVEAADFILIDVPSLNGK